MKKKILIFVIALVVISSAVLAVCLFAGKTYSDNSGDDQNGNHQNDDHQNTNGQNNTDTDGRGDDKDGDGVAPLYEILELGFVRDILLEHNVNATFGIKLKNRYSIEDTTLPVVLCCGITDEKAFDSLTVDKENVTVGLSLWNGENRLARLKEWSLAEFLREGNTYELKEVNEGKRRYTFKNEIRAEIPTDVLTPFAEKTNEIENRSLKLKLEFSESVGVVIDDPVTMYFSFAGDELYFSDSDGELFNRVGYDSSDFAGAAFRMAFAVNRVAAKKQKNVPVLMSFGTPSQYGKWSVAHDHRGNEAEYISVTVTDNNGKVYYERSFSVDEFVDGGYKYDEESNKFEVEELIYLTEDVLLANTVTFRIAAYDQNGEELSNKTDVETLTVRVDGEYIILGE